MKLHEMVAKQSIIIQIVWGDHNIEFASEVVESDGKGIYVTPYLYRGSELDLSIEVGGNIICSIFADDTNGQRISWKNLSLSTIERGNKKLYYLWANSHNHIGRSDDRRNHPRIILHKPGRIFDPESNEYYDIMIHDVSDIGVSFYASTSYVPRANQIVVMFEDYIEERRFSIKLKCAIARSHQKAGNVFYGCRILEDNREYILYGCIKRKKKRVRIPNAVSNNEVATEDIS